MKFLLIAVLCSSLAFQPVHGFLNRSPNKVVDPADPGISDEELQEDKLEIEQETTEQPSTFALDLSTDNTVDCKCGVKNDASIIESIGQVFLNPSKARSIDTYIIPAIPAIAREFPWIAAIAKPKNGKKRVVCGGSLINSKYLVTAAHCIRGQSTFRMEVWFNAHDVTQYLAKNDSLVEVRKIKRFIIHPQYDMSTVENDIGLIELAEPIDIRTFRPICLPFNYSYNAFEGLNGTVAGWGYTSPGGKNAQVLNKVDVPIWSHEDCQEKSLYGDKVLPKMICAGYEKGGVDACTNDSGGPLTVEQDGKSVLVGIVSWGHGCAKPKAPGVYTRVTEYTTWLNKYLSAGETCAA